MLVAMMKVGIMRMRMEKRGVCMQMGVGLVGWCLWCVSMRVVLVVAVQMLVLQLLVGVLVVVRHTKEHGGRQGKHDGTAVRHQSPHADDSALRPRRDRRGGRRGR